MFVRHTTHKKTAVISDVHVRSVLVWIQMTAVYGVSLTICACPGLFMMSHFRIYNVCRFWNAEKEHVPVSYIPYFHYCLFFNIENLIFLKNVLWLKYIKK